MSMLCTVCRHPEREKIDKALLTPSDTSRRIAKRFGLGESAVFRHGKKHLSSLLLKARDRRDKAALNNVVVLAEARAARETEHGEDMFAQFAQIGDLQVRTIKILDAADANGERTVALAAIREARSNIEMLCRMNAAMQAARQRELEEPMSDVDFIKDISLALFGHRGRPEPKPEPKSEPESDPEGW